MYEAYFLNRNTGEILRTGDPKNNPTVIFYPAYNTAGWSQISYDFYNILKTVQNFGLARGLEGWDSID